MILKIFIWMIILAFFHSFQETQIEGKAGWARHLPTFRISTFITKLLINKEITGYHLFMLIMWIIIFHGIYLFFPFTLKTELIIFGLLNWYFIIEDFLFFIVNPHFGIKSFRPGKISWHRRWFLNFIPVSYIIGAVIGTLLLILGGK
jgi:hypothetical protein